MHTSLYRSFDLTAAPPTANRGGAECHHVDTLSKTAALLHTEQRNQTLQGHKFAPSDKQQPPPATVHIGIGSHRAALTFKLAGAGFALRSAA